VQSETHAFIASDKLGLQRRCPDTGAASGTACTLGCVSSIRPMARGSDGLGSRQPCRDRRPGTRFLVQPGHRTSGRLSGGRATFEARPGEPADGRPPAAVLGIGAEMLESEIAGRIFEQVHTQRLVGRRDARQHNPSPVVDTTRHQVSVGEGCGRQCGSSRLTAGRAGTVGVMVVDGTSVHARAARRRHAPRHGPAHGGIAGRQRPGCQPAGTRPTHRRQHMFRHTQQTQYNWVASRRVVYVRPR